MDRHTSALEKVGVKVGFLISCILSSLIVFYILTSLGKISYSTSTLLKVFAVILLIATLGGLIQKYVL